MIIGHDTLSRLRPLRHRLLLYVAPLVPSLSMYPGLREPPEDYAVNEIPRYVRKRLIDFLNGRHPVPPKYLQRLLTPAEAPEARRVYRELRGMGLDAEGAVATMGFLARNLGMNVPDHSIGNIRAAGCSCIGKKGDYVIIITTAGEPVASDHTVVWCHEVICGAETNSKEVSAHKEAAEGRARAAFLKVRLAHTG